MLGKLFATAPLEIAEPCIFAQNERAWRRRVVSGDRHTSASGARGRREAGVWPRSFWEPPRRHVVCYSITLAVRGTLLWRGFASCRGGRFVGSVAGARVHHL